MKVVIFSIFMIFGIQALAKAPECKHPLKKDTASFLDIFNRVSDDAEIEVPEGKCKLIPEEVLSENDVSCERLLPLLQEAQNKLARKYDCYQITIGHTFRIENGKGASRIFPLCYICKKESR